MRLRDTGLLLIWTYGALTGQAVLRARNPLTEIELSCVVRREAGTSYDEGLQVEIQSPSGEVLRQAPARAGHSTTFKHLPPGIFVVCVKDAWAGSRCQSVDLYPPPDNRKARFSVELQPPCWSPGSSQLRVVNAAHLTVPEAARLEFGSWAREQQRGQGLKAARHLDRALEIHPNYPEALSNLGTLYHRAKDYSRALRVFERVTQIAPELYFGWLNLGATLLESGEVRQALQASVRALSLRPDDAFILYQVGLCHYKLGEFVEARMHLVRVIQLDPASATYPQLCLASIALREGKRNEADELLQQVIRLHPHSPRPPAMQVLIKQLLENPD